jgi:polyisoprenyl-teichoic acid--peptidoglycan teichoic acid transferase
MEKILSPLKDKEGVFVNTRTRSNVRKNRRKRWVRLALIFFLIISAGAGLYVYNIYSDVASAIDKMHNPISREKSKKRETKVEFDRKDPISILLVGVDERDGDSGRTDSMLVLTVNPEKNTTKIVSIPRDTRSRIVDKDQPNKLRYDKMNHAYAIGGIEMTIDSVEYFLNIPIDYYVEVSMEGFKDIVDAVDGIDVYNKYAFELDGVSLEEGSHHLNGEEALMYARMRKQDPRGDFGRQERQREVISKVIDKGASLSSLTNYNDILEALQDNIKTNLTLDDMVGMQSKYKKAAAAIEKLEIEGEGDNIDNGSGLTSWYFVVDDETRQELSDKLREHLDLSPSTVSTSNNDYNNS